MSDLTKETDINPKRRWRPGWRVAATLLVLAALPVAGIAVLAVQFDPSRVTPTLIAAVERTTGRHLTLSGPVSLHLSLTPTLEASGVSLSNPPGFPDPTFLMLDKVEAKIALLPLFSHQLEILNLVLVGPHITLERNADGSGNWDFSAPTEGAPLAKPTGRRAFSLALQSVEIRGGQIALRLQPHAPPVTLALARITGTAASLATPLHLHAGATLGTTPFTLDGVTGPVERFSGPDNGPWSIDLTLRVAGASATISGAIAHPRNGEGYDLAVSATIPALEAVGAALSTGALNGGALPPVRDIAFSARVRDEGTLWPGVEKLSLIAGPSDLSTMVPGLSLTSLNVSMASLSQPVALNATGTFGSQLVTVLGSLGAPQTFLPVAGTPPVSLPVSLAVQVGDAKASVSGAIATPATLSGAALAVTASIPNLSALGQDAGIALPTWKNILLQTTLVDPGGQGLTNAIGLDSLTASMDNATLGGDASQYFGAQRRLELALTVTQANLDALLAAFPPPAASPPTETSASAIPIPLPDIPLPLGLLHNANADIQLAANALVWNHATYTALQAHAQLNKGVLTIAPVSGELPGGSFSANAQIDATKEPATEELHITAPALALPPLLAAVSLPSTSAAGIVQSRLDATSVGDNLPAIAANLTGQLGLASVSDVIDRSLLGGLLPKGTTQGPVSVRCAALRLDVTKGAGTISALTLASAPLTFTGSGTVSFPQNTLAVALVPRNASGEAMQPLQFSGSLFPPALSSQPAPQPVSPPQGAANTDVCPATLALARLGQPGTAPTASPPTAIATQPAPASGAPKNLLNSLLGP